jgi:para-nitrobenzyl esterase
MVENYRKALQRLYGEKAADAFSRYPASSEAEVLDAARDLAGDRFIGYSTWKWVDLATKTGGKPTYYYLYARPRPRMLRKESGDEEPPRGAVHSAEIEYAMGNLDTHKAYAWTPDDYKVSRVMQEYFANFVKTGDPNGAGLPEWPQFGSDGRMVIDVETRAEKDIVRPRYEFLDQFYTKR